MLPKRCPLNPGTCNLRHNRIRRISLSKYLPYAFVMRPYTPMFLDTERTCKKLLNQFNCRVIQAKDEGFVGAGFCQICEECLYAHFGISEITGLNPNVMLETGLMLAESKPVILTLNIGITPITSIPFDVRPLLLVTYNNNVELKSGLRSKIEFVFAELKSKKLI